MTLNPSRQFSLKFLLLFVLWIGSALTLWHNYHAWTKVKTISTTDYFSALVVSKKGDQVIASDHYHTVRVWNASNWTESVLMPLTTASVFGAEFVDEKRVLIWADDNTIRILDSHTGSELKSFTSQDKLYRVTASPVGEQFATRSEDGAIVLWNITTGEKTSLTKDGGGVFEIAFSPDGKRLVSGGKNGVHVWDCTTGKLLHADEGLRTFNCQFSGDGRFIVICDFEHSVFFLDANTYIPTGFNLNQSGLVEYCICAHDGSRIITRSIYSKLLLWDTSSGTELESFAAGNPAVAVFMPYDEQLLTNENGMTLWQRNRHESRYGIFALFEFWLALLLTVYVAFKTLPVVVAGIKRAQVSTWVDPIPAFVFIFAGIALTPIALFASYVSAGSGHGHYVAARLFYPIPLLLTFNGSISNTILLCAAVQFTLYGVIVGLSKRKLNVLMIVAAVHGAAALLVFYGGVLSGFN